MNTTANVGKRAAATAYDLALFYAPFLAAQSSWSPEPLKLVFAVATLGALVWQARSLGRDGTTFGKRRWGLRVVSRRTGENAGVVVNALLRPAVAWGPAVAAMAFDAFPLWLLVDGAVLLWRKDRRSLHDLLAGTEVVETVP
ncbi:MAG: RDD family protein [Elusimicrobia bacterium]|nr:RDD family protein [Elusimicrobiota bacterium]